VAEDNGKYTTVGLTPNRSSTGITEFWPKKLSQGDRDRIKKLMRKCEEVAKGYHPSNEVRGLRIAQLLGGWKKISGVSSSPIWSSLACGKNYYLNSHVDVLDRHGVVLQTLVGVVVGGVGFWQLLQLWFGRHHFQACLTDLCILGIRFLKRHGCVHW
jgi:hypothetical protein